MDRKTEPEYDSTMVSPEWKLRLYVTDWTPRCVLAYKNLKSVCKNHLKGECDIEVVDLLEDPEIARREQIVAVPTLVKISPKPARVLIGDFSKEERVLKGLDIES